MSDKTEPSDGMIREAWTRAFPKIAGDPLGIINLPSPYAAFIAGYKSASGRAGVATHNTVSREQIETVVSGILVANTDPLMTHEYGEVSVTSDIYELGSLISAAVLALLVPTSKPGGDS